MQSLSHTPKGAGVYTATLESVAFQNPFFRKELIAAFTDLRREKSESMSESEPALRLSKIVKHHTKMSLTFSLDQFDPCVELPRVDRNNPLANQFLRQVVDSADGLRIINEAKKFQAFGSVNLKEGTVGGVFEDVHTVIHLPVSMIAGSKFTEDELTAITLHEIGHIFTYFEFMMRSTRTNQVLAGLAKALDKTDGLEKREAVLTNAAEAMRLRNLDAKELAKATNHDIVAVVLISNAIAECKSELGTNIYDNSTWEMLADQYATRQGAGMDLVSALNKLYKNSMEISYRNLPTYLFMEAAKLLLLVSGGGTPAGLLLLLIDSEGDSTYDRPGARMQRIRNQIIENLKDKKLSPAVVSELTADLDAIDDIMSRIHDRRQWLGVVMDVVWPYYRKARTQYELQRDLENIAMNEIFAKAASLRAQAVTAKSASTGS